MSADARRRQLLDAILAAPDDDELRLVYADALASAGDTEHAELICAQVAIARARGPDQPDPPLCTRVADIERVRDRDKAVYARDWIALLAPSLVTLAEELESKHGRRIAGAIAQHASDWSFERGFVVSIEIDSVTLAEHAETILGEAPIREIRLLHAEPDDPERACAAAASLAACRHLAHVRVIDATAGSFGGRSGDARALEAFLASPHLTNLRQLTLDADASELAARAIADAHSRLPALRVLRFWSMSGNGTGVGDDGAIALAESPVCARLEVLGLWGAEIEAAGASALARGLRAIRQLSLNPVWYFANEIGVVGARALAAAEGLSQLETLHLAGTEIGDEGLAAIASAPWFANLRELDVSDNFITDRGLTALAASPCARRLERLRLCSGTHGGGSGTDVSIEGVRSLAALPALREVALGREDENESWLSFPFDDDELADKFDDDDT